MMENIMLSSLAIYRFLLYFFPFTEKILTTNVNVMAMTVKMLYIIIFIPNFLIRLIKLGMVANTFTETGNMTYVSNPQMDLADSAMQKSYFY
uniref:Serpentine receptor class gamma n=1 Tax=Caenorhabditis tropicalis TaxID=1561998 RepID=A0A1I7T6N2_9PELO